MGSRLLLPGPIDVVLRLAVLCAEGPFWASVGYSTLRILLGFGLAFACALALGALAHLSSAFDELLRPPLAALKSTPLVCIVVLLLLWLGSGWVSAAAVFLVVFPPVFFSIVEALGMTDAKVAEMLAAFRVPAPRRALAQAWPEAVPYVAAACRSACGMAWKAGVAAELIGSPLGSVGERIYQAKLLLETTDVLAWTVVVILASALFERLFVGLLRGSAALSLSLSTRGLGTRAGRADPPAARAIELRDASVRLGDTVVLDAASLEVPAGSRLCLTDPSGTGKTTLLRVMAGLLKPDAGEVEPPPSVGMVFQEARLVERLSATDNILLCAGGATTREEVVGALAQLVPDAPPDQLVSELSGGQRRRVELLRALLSPSAAVLLDEPFASLDSASRAAARRTVGERLAGRTLVMATHDASDVQALGAETFSLVARRGDPRQRPIRIEPDKLGPTDSSCQS